MRRSRREALDGAEVFGSRSWSGLTGGWTGVEWSAVEILKWEWVVPRESERREEAVQLREEAIGCLQGLLELRAPEDRVVDKLADVEQH